MLIKPLLSLVQTRTYLCTPASMRISPFLWNIFTKFNTVHALWRWHRRIEVYRQPQNLVQLFIGRALYSLCDEASIRVAAQCLLTASRIMSCSEQQSKLSRSYRQWVWAIKGHYSEPVNIPWEKKASSIFSASLTYTCKKAACTLSLRTIRMIKHTALMWVELFKLNMMIMDTIDAICWSPDAREDAKNESYLHINKCIHELVDKKDQILDSLDSNKKLLSAILPGGSKDYDHLVLVVNRAIKVSQSISTTTDVTNRYFGRLGKLIVRKSKETLQQIATLHSSEKKVIYTSPENNVSKIHNREFLLTFGVS